ncbi:MAG: RNA methyltransferase, partial [Bacteroidota bacterium]
MGPEGIIDVLGEFVSEHKKSLIQKVLSQRTRHITLVFEDIDKSHNVSAVLRTAECMGIQDLHFIKNNNDYSVNPIITQGAAKWVTLHHHNSSSNNVKSCYKQLRKANYQILATSLHKTSQSIYDIDPSQKTAIVFGTESNGISKEAGALADGYVHIPMNGFTESFNLSVSAAICLTALKQKLNKWPIINEDESQIL